MVLNKKETVAGFLSSFRKSENLIKTDNSKKQHIDYNADIINDNPEILENKSNLNEENFNHQKEEEESEFSKYVFVGIKKIKETVELEEQRNGKIIFRDQNSTLLQSWLKIYEEQYKNEQYWPSIFLRNETFIHINLDLQGFRINPEYGKAKTVIGNNYFWFTLTTTNIFFRSKRKDLNPLDIIFIEDILKIENFDDYGESDTCFKLYNKQSVTWKFCAYNLEVKYRWICAISELKHFEFSQCNQNDYEIEVIEKVTTTPIILVPLPSRFCNDGWNYLNNGRDWECDCIEGKEQSPINLPTKDKCIQTTIKPRFEYINTELYNSITTKDNLNKKGELIKIRYLMNALRIHCPNFGRVVTFDGTVYQASEIIFHTPSDHTIDGKRYPMEMQVIHNGISTSDVGKQLVLCFLFTAKAGIYNGFFEDLDYLNLPNFILNEQTIDKQLFIPKVLFSKKEIESGERVYMRDFSFYTYQGSLTSPPCNEDTIVYVAAEPIDLSITVINLFREAILGDPEKKEIIMNGNVEDQELVYDALLKREQDLYNESVIYKNDEVNILSGNYRITQNLGHRKVFYYQCVDCQKKIAPKLEGHFEKIGTKTTQYLYTSEDKPTGFPNSFVVDKDEANGIAKKNTEIQLNYNSG